MINIERIFKNNTLTIEDILLSYLNDEIDNFIKNNNLNLELNNTTSSKNEGDVNNI